MSLLDSLLSPFVRTPATTTPTAPPMLPEPAPVEPRAVEPVEVAPAPAPAPAPVAVVHNAGDMERGFVDDLRFREGDAATEQVLRSLVGDLNGRNSDVAALLLGSLRSSTPPRKGTQELLAAHRYMPHLRSVVGRIAQSVAAVRWRVYKTPRSRAFNDAKGYVMRSAGTDDVAQIAAVRMARVKEAVDTGDLAEAPNHLIARLLAKANPAQTGFATRKLVQTHLETAGEGFLLREDNMAGLPVELWPIPPHWVKDTPRPGSDFFDLQWNGPRVRVAADRIWWLKDLDAERPYDRGAGVGMAVADELDVDEYASKHLKGWFANSAIPSMLVGVEGASPDETEIAQQDWRQRNQGPNRRNRVHFHNGKLTAVRLDDKFSDMEIVDVRKYQAQITRETWNVPPEVLGHVENSNLATIEEAINILAMLVVVPRLEFWFSEVNEVLSRWFPDGDRVIAVYENPVRPNMKQVLEAAKTASSVPTVNDWRKWMALAPLDGGDDLHVVGGRFVKWDKNGSPEPEPVPAPGGPKPPTPAKTTPSPVRKSPGANAVDEAVAAVSTGAATDETVPLMKRLIESFGADALRSIGIGASLNMFDPLVVDFIANYAGDRIAGINDTTKAALRVELMQGVAAGEGIGPLSRRVREVFTEANGVRSRLIARTEVVGASNFARWAGYVQTGEAVVPAKRWLTTMDNRARSAHVKINAQLRKLQQPFECEGHKAQHPGAFGVARLDCNCRCVLVPVLEIDENGNEKTPLTVEQESLIWRAYDREVALWEGTFGEGWRKVFARQQHEVLRALERFA